MSGEHFLLAFGGGGGAVDYGMGGADVVAAETEGAAGAPLRTAVVHGDILHRATARAETARDAGRSRCEGLGRHGKSTEPGVDHGGFQPRPAAAVDIAL